MLLNITKKGDILLEEGNKNDMSIIDENISKSIIFIFFS